GSPMELYHHPANLFVAGFLGTPKMGFLRGRISRAEAAGVEVEAPFFTRLKVTSSRPCSLMAIDGLRGRKLP
ncbi:hypothetical protein AB0P48_32800, partial [Streptomyces halstedii]